MRILQRIEEADFNVFTARPTLTPRDAPWLVWRALTWNGS
jgi:hypothetical protein